MQSFFFLSSADCKYKFEIWGECDAASGMKSRTGTLQKALYHAECQPVITVQKPCSTKNKAKSKGKKNVHQVHPSGSDDNIFLPLHDNFFFLVLKCTSQLQLNFSIYSIEKTGEACDHLVYKSFTKKTIARTNLFVFVWTMVKALHTSTVSFVLVRTQGLQWVFE